MNTDRSATLTPSQFLATQHHDIDAVVKDAMDGKIDTASLGAALLLLRRHLYLEEAVLFPPLEAEGLMMPIFVMKREHGQMWPVIGKLEAACTGGQLDASVADTARTLFQLLQIHNPKEEQIVYSAADTHATKHPDDDLVAAMEGAAMPDGWACQTAGKQPGGFARFPATTTACDTRGNK